MMLPTQKKWIMVQPAAVHAPDRISGFPMTTSLSWPLLLSRGAQEVEHLLALPLVQGALREEVRYQTPNRAVEDPLDEPIEHATGGGVPADPGLPEEAARPRR